MKTWNQENAVLAPLVFGLTLRGDSALSTAKGCFRTSARCVPQSFRYETARVANSTSRTAERVVRFVQVKSQPSEPAYPLMARYFDSTPGREANLGNTIWATGLLPLPSGAAEPAIPSNLTALQLEVFFIKRDRERILGYSELALFRKLFVSSLLPYDPDLTVIGGQFEFEEHYWQRSTPAPPPLKVKEAPTTGRPTCSCNRDIAPGQRFCDQCGAPIVGEVK